MVPKPQSGIFKGSVKGDPYVYGGTNRGSRRRESEFIDSNPPVLIHLSLPAECEDIVVGLFWDFQFKFSEQNSIIFHGLFESDIWNFECGAVYAAGVVL